MIKHLALLGLMIMTEIKITGPEISIEMAKKEGWYGKNGSKANNAGINA